MSVAVEAVVAESRRLAEMRIADVNEAHEFATSVNAQHRHYSTPGETISVT
jgi:hypothetical protein